jgi:transcriptional regulator with XRE-family HTH domain
MPATVRAIARGSFVADRQLNEIASELRERRLMLNISQELLAGACRISRKHYGRIETGRLQTLTIVELNRIAAALGLTTSIRLFPVGLPIRDAGHAHKLQSLVASVAPPLTCRLEVPLRRIEDRPEWRAWDLMLIGDGARTAMELEMRLRDVQAMRRRVDLKRRDDPTESFVLLVADTRTNRLVLAEYADLFRDLPRLRPSIVRSALAAGRHPPTGLLLI